MEILLEILFLTINIKKTLKSPSLKNGKRQQKNRARNGN
jgi:hypothetical protein